MAKNLGTLRNPYFIMFYTGYFDYHHRRLFFFSNLHACSSVQILLQAAISRTHVRYEIEDFAGRYAIPIIVLITGKIQISIDESILSRAT